jgi:Ca-activated chloride channel family protein
MKLFIKGENMSKYITNKIIILITLSLIAMVFVYQCHPNKSNSQDLEEYKRNAPPVKLDDIKQGALVKKIENLDLYAILPQLETKVQINIEGMVASTTVDQVFTNSSDEPVDAIYVFPLPQNAAVHDMKMLINDRLIQGVIKEKEEAKETFEIAKAEGKHASLTEQERPNVFTNFVANIMPGDTIIVRLTYVEKLTYKAGTFKVRFPMVVAPRYIPGHEITGYSGKGWAYDTDIVPDASHITPPVVSPGMRSGNLVSLNVNINAGLPISFVGSVSHEINIIQVDASAYRVDLKKKKVIPNKDFILEYRIKSGNEPKAALFAVTKGSDNYFMLMAVPPVNVKKNQSMKKEIVFVLDISGSMAGASNDQAKSGLISTLNLLARGDYFNIIAFNRTYDVLAPYSLQASVSNIINGINYVNRLEADGGTEAQPALKHAMNMTHQSDTLKMIIFLTDGSVGNENQLIALVNQDIGKSRLFTVGIGSAPNSYLLEKVSQFGRGTSTHISNINEVESKINELFSKIENPVLTDLKLDISDKAEVVPDPIPDLFAAQPLIILGRVDDLLSTKTRLIGKTLNSYFTLDIPLDFRTATKEPAIPTLWARSKISNLMDEYRLGNEGVKSEIIDVAINHKLMTKFTSFVAVEHKIVNSIGKSRIHAIPTELPEGWVYEKVIKGEGLVKLASLPQTASKAPLIAIIGFVLITTGAFMGFIKITQDAKQKGYNV